MHFFRHKYIFILFSIALLIATQSVLAYQEILGDPLAGGHPNSYLQDVDTHDKGVIGGRGEVSDINPPKSGTVQIPKSPEVGIPSISKVQHLIINTVGIGELCTLGTHIAETWWLNPDHPITKASELQELIKDATVRDTRLRRVAIFDNKLDMYYLLPATRYGMFDVNYEMHIIANTDTMRMKIENPGWVTNTNSQHAVVSEAFSIGIPKLLPKEVIEALGDPATTIISRQAKLIEVISRVMAEVPVYPHVNSFFACVIAPFLLYIIIAIIAALLLIWYMTRNVRKLHMQNNRLAQTNIFIGVNREEEHTEKSESTSYAVGWRTKESSETDEEPREQAPEHTTVFTVPANKEESSLLETPSNAAKFLENDFEEQDDEAEKSKSVFDILKNKF